jgi:hypothetical protein
MASSSSGEGTVFFGKRGDVLRGPVRRKSRTGPFLTALKKSLGDSLTSEKPEFHDCSRNIQKLVRVLSQTHLMHLTTPFCLKMHFNIIPPTFTRVFYVDSSH